jgi:hypothetical protein
MTAFPITFAKFSERTAREEATGFPFSVSYISADIVKVF